MPETDLLEPASVDWLEIAERVLGVAMTIYCLWVLCPGLPSRTHTEWQRIRSTWNARRLREHEMNRMAWEVYLVRTLMEGDSGGLAGRLEL